MRRWVFIAFYSNFLTSCEDIDRDPARINDALFYQRIIRLRIGASSSLPLLFSPVSKILENVSVSRRTQFIKTKLYINHKWNWNSFLMKLVFLYLMSPLVTRCVVKGAAIIRNILEKRTLFGRFCSLFSSRFVKVFRYVTNRSCWLSAR